MKTVLLPIFALVVAFLAFDPTKVLAQSPAPAQDFTYQKPGTLTSPAAGQGFAGRFIYAPDILFPIKLADDERAFVNSQVYSPGGMDGGPGGQCDHVNYNMPWSDVFCEKRTWSVPLCPTGKGHQGVDIRQPRCANMASTAVAAEDGKVIDTDSYVSMVKIRGDSGRTYRYLHLEPTSFQVSRNQRVTKGQELGKISNLMNGAHQTTWHLHFDIQANIASVSGGATATFVPPYTSLVAAYRRLKGIPPADSNGMLNRDPTREL
jgi:murein DD-endopeptidase MepM/ murein hydrolase activator NlpD